MRSGSELRWSLEALGASIAISFSNYFFFFSLYVSWSEHERDEKIRCTGQAL